MFFLFSFFFASRFFSKFLFFVFSYTLKRLRCCPSQKKNLSKQWNGKHKVASTKTANFSSWLQLTENLCPDCFSLFSSQDLSAIFVILMLKAFICCLSLSKQKKQNKIWNVIIVPTINLQKELTWLLFNTKSSKLFFLKTDCKILEILYKLW